MSRKHPHIVNLEELPTSTVTQGTLYTHYRKQLGIPAQGKALGCSWMELPPGKASWPLHFHASNEEAIFILEGEGTVRIGSESVPVRAGDYISFPVGPQFAHQMINTSENPLRYLCFSTMNPTDISVYPESKKIGVFAGAAPGGLKKERFVDAFYKVDSSVGYWEGEIVEKEEK